MILDVLASITGMAVVLVCALAFIPSVVGAPRQRLELAAGVGGWVGLSTALGAMGALAFSPGETVPLIGVLCGLPLLIAGGLALTSPKARAAFMRVPLPVLVGLNSMRVLGVIFLLLALSGRLSGPFPYFAGIGDILTGVAAIPLALGIARTGKVPEVLLRQWNLFGVADLVLALFLGITSSPGSPLQLIHAGVGSTAVQHLPYSLIPTVLVPFFLITHGIVAAQLAARHTATLPAHA